MALFYVAIRRESVSLFMFPILSHFKVFSSVRFHFFVAWNIHIVAFLPFFLVIVVLLIFVVSILFCGSCYQSFSALFLCSPRVVVLMHQRYLQTRWVFFLLLFLTPRACLRHLLDVQPYTSSWDFLCSGPFVEVLPSFNLRMVSSILRGGQPRCLILWWDFCYIVYFRIVFSFSWDTLFNFFLLSPLVLWRPLTIFSSICKFPFLRAFWSFLDLVVLFLPAFVISHFSLLAWHFFLC